VERGTLNTERGTRNVEHGTRNTERLSNHSINKLTQKHHGKD